ncbi:MAG: C-terminal binding protein [Planctomycetes bacterium]|nr:C-terminal binding protein [Planctomycetota bacterium]
MPKVVITDFTFGDVEIEKSVLEPIGCEVAAWKQAGTPIELTHRMSDADGVITQFATLSAAIINGLQRARVIVRYGVGVDNVDLEAARARGIPVCNVPDYCMDEVADHTLALLLATTRQIVANCCQVRDGRWGLAVPLTAMNALRDLTIGVVGFGRIGREVARRLKGFHCRVMVHDPAVSPVAILEAGCEPAMLESVLAQSDVVTLHCPSTATTRKMIRCETIAMMKPGVILINVGRGDLVDSSALVEALQQGRISAAGLDVFDPEPIDPDSPLLKMANVIVTPHIASASEKAVAKLRFTAAEIAAKAIRGEPLPNVVNGVQVARQS